MSSLIITCLLCFVDITGNLMFWEIGIVDLGDMGAWGGGRNGSRESVVRMYYMREE